MKQLTASALVTDFGCEDHSGGIPEQFFIGVGTLQNAGATQISFLSNSKYLDEALQSGAGAIVCARSAVEGLAQKYRGRIFVAVDPYVTFARLSQFFFVPVIGYSGQSEKASIDATAKVDPSATIFPFVSLVSSFRSHPGASQSRQECPLLSTN